MFEKLGNYTIYILVHTHYIRCHLNTTNIYLQIETFKNSNNI